MSQSVGAYVLYENSLEDEYTQRMLRAFRQEVDLLLLVHSADRDGFVPASLDIEIDQFIRVDVDFKKSLVHNFKAVVSAFREYDETYTHLIYCSSHVMGPVVEETGWLRGAVDVVDDVWSSYWHNVSIDPRIDDDVSISSVPVFDLIVFARRIFDSDRLNEIISSTQPSEDYWSEFKEFVIPFAEALQQDGRHVSYPIEPHAAETIEPYSLEVHRIVEAGAPIFRKSILKLDPLLHDLQATHLKALLDYLRLTNKELYAILVRYGLRNLSARTFATIFDEYRILGDGKPLDARGKEWSFGSVGVFIHAYYSYMMPEFWQYVSRIPCDYHLYITVATPEDGVHVKEFLAEAGFPDERSDVRVVAVNRGRDMSSLFITFRDVILADKHEICLRLHSKKTPQVSPLVSTEFKAHLFENLLYSDAYVAELLDILEAEDDVGLVVPPLIHIGFATLGHSWFANKSYFLDIAKKLDIDAPVDEDTPLTAYGTMYWFRSKALRKLFEWEWSFDEYNEEPLHVDGGLAHVQERLIGIVAQAAGYRTLSVMNPAAAARNYVKLEYKHSKLSSYFPDGNVLSQRKHMQRIKREMRRVKSDHELLESLMALLGEDGGRARSQKSVVEKTASGVTNMVHHGKAFAKICWWRIGGDVRKYRALGLGDTKSNVLNRPYAEYHLQAINRVIELEQAAAEKTPGGVTRLTKMARRVIDSSDFDYGYYTKTYPDSIRYRGGPLFHYMENWQRGFMNPSVSFDTLGYLFANRDVWRRRINPLYHYIAFGKAEGRKFAARSKDGIVIEDAELVM